MRWIAPPLVAAFWLHALTGAGSDAVLDRWLYLAVVLAAALSCVARARSAPLIWGALGAGLLAKAAGDVLYALAPDLAAVPVPSISDPFWLAVYPCAYTALLALTHRRLGRLLWTTRLDGLICGLAVAALLACFTVPAASDAARGAPLAEQLTTLAYPLGDLALLGTIVAAVAVGGWRTDGTLTTLAVAVICWEAGDLLYLYDAGGVLGRVADALVLTGVAAFGWASRPSTRRHVGGPRGVLMPVAFAALALGVVAVSLPLELNGVALGVAVCALALMLGRTAIALREHRELLAETRAEAMTDALTGLPNRRAFAERVESVLFGRQPHVLVALDLNGFKAYNDSLGHGAGDALLVLLGQRLGEALRDSASAFRVGGDEFCVLTPCDPASADRVARRCVEALTLEREGLAISAAMGAVMLPGDFADVDAALAAADVLMYQDKRALRRAAAPA